MCQPRRNAGRVRAETSARTLTRPDLAPRPSSRRKAIILKKFVKRIALAVITLAVGLGTPAVMAGAASAAVTPVIYNKLYVTISGVKYHNGHAYYSVMTWYTPGYHRIYGSSSSSSLVVRFGIRPGASIPRLALQPVAQSESANAEPTG